jgi:hypothetical protein
MGNLERENLKLNLHLIAYIVNIKFCYFSADSAIKSKLHDHTLFLHPPLPSPFLSPPPPLLIFEEEAKVLSEFETGEVLLIL